MQFLFRIYSFWKNLIAKLFIFGPYQWVISESRLWVKISNDAHQKHQKLLEHYNFVIKIEGDMAVWEVAF